MIFRRNIEFYLHMFASRPAFKIGSCLYFLCLVVGIAFRNPIFAFMNLIWLVLLLSDRLDQLHRIPAGLLAPHYRFEQSIMALSLIAIFGGVPLLSAAVSIEQFLVFAGLGLTITGVILLLTYMAAAARWIVPLLAVLVFQQQISGIGGLGLIPWSFTILCGSVLIGWYVYLQGRRRELKPLVSARWLAVRRTPVDMKLTWLRVFGRWLPVPNGKLLLWGVFNPSAYLAFVLLVIIVVEIVLRFDVLILLFFLFMFANLQVRGYLLFTDLDRLWMASTFRSKTTFLLALAAVLTVCIIFQTTVMLAYVTYRLESIVSVHVPDPQTDMIEVLTLALLLVCCHLCRWWELTCWTVLGAAMVFMIAFPTWTSPIVVVLVVVLWTLSIYNYVRRSLRPNGRLVEPVLLSHDART